MASNRNTRAVVSFLGIVPVASVKQHQHALLKRYFPEGDAPAGGQTAAGFAALKKALGRLAKSEFGATVSPADIVLAHDKRGAPRIVSMPLAAAVKKRIHVSVTHTATHAYGLAAAKRKRHENAG
ncbi:MAG TPA: hypothetical protein VLX68_06905 [Chitinivibrionales bacterium]|nr:hypothetical protein [Chitinivibrionales bacterium]